MESPRGDETTGPAVESGLVTRGRRVDDVSIQQFLDAGSRPQFVWADDASVVAGHGAAAAVDAAGRGRFGRVRTAADRLFAGADVGDALPHAARPRLFGGFAFHAENGDSERWRGFEDAGFVLPAVQMTRTGDGTWLSATATGPSATVSADRRLERWYDRITDIDPEPPASLPTVTDRRVTPSRTGWRRQVTDALGSVDRGDLRKVVLAQALTLDLSGPLSVPALLDRLASTYPDCRRFLFSPADGGTFFGVTPERLVSLHGRTVRTVALAGSTGRGDTPAEDEWLADQLLDSTKDSREHDYVVETIRDQLVPFANDVRTGERTIRRLATVQHLQTPVTADLTDDEHVLSLVEALHRTPAVGGLPPDAALATIRETEAFDRGWYAAPVGWFDADGNGSFAVAIRSALVDDDEATLFAGAGIVEDSDPDAEWDEVQLKYRPILDELE
jgi:menaquinone-specific isochorismate synthase